MTQQTNRKRDRLHIAAKILILSYNLEQERKLDIEVFLPSNAVLEAVAFLIARGNEIQMLEALNPILKKEEQIDASREDPQSSEE